VSAKFPIRLNLVSIQSATIKQELSSRKILSVINLCLNILKLSQNSGYYLVLTFMSGDVLNIRI